MEIGTVDLSSWRATLAQELRAKEYELASLREENAALRAQLAVVRAREAS